MAIPLPRGLAMAMANAYLNITYHALKAISETIDSANDFCSPIRLIRV
jgi:hypothetical protein